MADRKQYVDSCVVRRSKNKRTERSPDYYGFVDVSKELLASLVSQYKEHGKAAINVLMYEKETQSGEMTVMYLRPGDPTWKPHSGGGETSGERSPEDVLDDAPPF